MDHRPAVLILLVFGVLVAAPRGRARAQEAPEKKVISLAERQDKARKEMDKLLQRIQEIAERLKERGDVQQADKLMEAFAKIQEVELLPDLRKVVDTLRDARLWEALDQQKEILEKIEMILDLLLDRKSYEDLDQNAKELEQIGKKLADLREEEQRHIEKLETITKEGGAQVSEEVRQLAQAIEDLLAGQRALVQRTRAADVGESLKAVDKALKDLDAVMAGQEDLLQKIEGVEGLTPQEASLLEKALQGLEELAAKQARAARAAARKGTAADLEALAGALDRVRKEQDVLAQDNRAEGKRLGKDGLSEAFLKLQELTDRQRALKELTRAAGELEAIRKMQAEIASRAGGDESWAKERAGAQGKAADQIRKVVSQSLVRAMEDPNLSPADREALKAASEAADKAGEALKASSRAGSEGAPDTAGKAKEALKALEEALKNLEPVVGKDWSKLKATQAELATAADQAAAAAQTPADQKDDVDEVGKVGREAAAQAAKKAAEKMRESLDALKGRDGAEATGRQSEALGELTKAARAVRDVLDRKTPEIEAQADRQGELSREAGALAEALKKAAKEEPLGETGSVGAALKRSGEQAEEARRHQEDAAGNLSQGANQEAGQSQDAAGKALDEAARSLAEALGKAKGPEGREDIAREEEGAAKQAQDVARKMGQAAETLKKRDAGARGSQMEGLSKGVESAAQKAREAGEAARGGDRERAARAADEAKKSLEEAQRGLEEFLKGSRPDLKAEAKEQDDLRRAAEKVADAVSAVGKDPSSSSARSEATEAANTMRKGASKMGEASSKLDERNPRGAEVDGKKALEHLKEARAKAEEFRRRLLEKSDPDREAAVKQQERLKEEAEKVAEKLEEMAKKEPESQAGAPSPSKKASSSMKQAGGHMEKGAENLVNRNFPETEEEQREALKAMEEARRELKKMEDEAIRQAKERELNALVREQAGTEEKTKLTEEELEKLKRLMEARDAGRAARAMNQAKDKVSSMDLIPAKEKMEEARDFLEKAEEAVKEQQRRYQQLAQEQLIFQIKTMLKDLLEAQKKINGQVEEMGARVDNGQRLLRGHVRTLLTAADEQEVLAGRMVEIEKKIEAQAKVFSWVARSVSEDMQGIADLLRDNPPDVGPFTRGLGLEVASRLSELLEAFKLELKQRQKPPGGG